MRLNTNTKGIFYHAGLLLACCFILMPVAASAQLVIEMEDVGYSGDVRWQQASGAGSIKQSVGFDLSFIPFPFDTTIHFGGSVVNECSVSFGSICSSFDFPLHLGDSGTVELDGFSNFKLIYEADAMDVLIIASGNALALRVNWSLVQNDVVIGTGYYFFTKSGIFANLGDFVDLGQGPEYVVQVKSWSNTTTSVQSVWPGDTNNDGVVNQADILPIGLHWQRTGPARDNASNAWRGQVAQLWSPEAATYADANGDGVVNQGDILAIGLNWAKTHGSQAMNLAKANLSNDFSSAANLSFVITGDAKPGEDFVIDIQANEAANLFGLSFELVFSPNSFIEILSAEKGSGNLLGDDIIFFPTVENDKGKVSIGLSRKAGQGGVDGSGLVARLNARMSANAVIGQDTTSLQLQNVAANDPDGNAITFEVTAGTLVTDVENSDGNSIPTGFALFQNYPNPFNPTTEISYNLPKSTEVKLQIFDILGRSVRTLVNQQQPAGAYSVLWDAHDDNGVAVASGVYIYLIKTSSFVAQRKLLFLK